MSKWFFSLIFLFLPIPVYPQTVLYLGKIASSQNQGTAQDPFITLDLALTHIKNTTDSYHLILLTDMTLGSYSTISNNITFSPNDTLTQTTLSINGAFLKLEKYLNINFQNLKFDILSFYADVWSLTDTQCAFLLYGFVNLTFQSCIFNQSLINEDFSMYSAVVYANAESVSQKYTTNVRFLSVSVIQQNLGLISFMIIYALISNTYIDNFTYYAPDINDFWSLFYIWSGTIFLSNSNISSSKIPSVINTIGSNIYVTNCLFQNLSLPQTTTLFLFNDKGNYYTQLPYITTVNQVIFANVSFDAVRSFNISSSSSSSLIFPLLIYGSHSVTYPLIYNLTNVAFVNNIAYNNLMSVTYSYSNFWLINITILNNICYTAIMLENGAYLSLSNSSCVNNNNDQVTRGKNINQEFGACLDLINTRNSTFSNIAIVSCYSRITTCGIRIYMESENIRFSAYQEVNMTNVSFINNAVSLLSVYKAGAALYIFSEVTLIIRISDSTFSANRVEIVTVQNIIGAPCIRSIGLVESIYIKNTVFKDDLSNFQSSCINFNGEFLSIIDSVFSNNSYSASSNDTLTALITEPGLGTISFFGQGILIQNTSFINNSNTKAGGVLIDGHDDVFNLSVTFKNVIFEGNSVSTYGGAFYFGQGILNLKGYFEGITCRNNSAAMSKCNSFKGGRIKSIEGGCGAVFFQKTACLLVINQSSFENNFAKLFGGAFYLQHSFGELIFENNSFIKNGMNASEQVTGGGGALYSLGTTTTLIFLRNNTFKQNIATRTAGILLMSSNITEINNIYIENNASTSTSFSMEAIGILSSSGNQYIREYSGESSIFSISVMCTFTIKDVTFQDVISDVGCISLSSNLNGSIENLTINNLVTLNGPALSFLELPSNILISKFTYTSNSSSKQPILFMIWKSNLTFVNVTVNIPMVVGVFYIQYQSSVKLDNFTLVSLTCTSADKGCIFHAVANSTLSANLLKISDITAISSLVHGDSSRIELFNADLKNILIQGESEAFLITFYIGVLNVDVLRLRSFFGGALSSDQSNITLSGVSLSLNDYNVSQSAFDGSLFTISKPLKFSLKNSDFANLSSTSQGGLFTITEGNTKDYFTIDNCSFENISTTKQGAVFYLENVGNMNISDSVFSNNHADQDGGVCVYTEANEAELSLTFNACEFNGNTASRNGGVFMLMDKLVILNGGNFTGNNATYGPEIAAYPIRLLLQGQVSSSVLSQYLDNYTCSSPLVPNETTYYDSSVCPSSFMLYNERPGVTIATTLSFRIVDYLNQTVSTLNGGLSYIEVKSTKTYTNSNESDLNLIGFTTTSLVNGSFSFSKLEISGQQNSLYYLFVRSQAIITTNENNSRFGMNFSLGDNEFRLNGDYFYRIPIYLNSCLEGEIFDKTANNLACKVCEEGKYAKDNYTCSDCFDTAKTNCTGGILQLRKGYWMNLPFSGFENIFECPEFDACLGGKDSECAKGYAGPLCQTCVDVDGVRYSKGSSETVCGACMETSLLVTVITVLILLCFLVFAVFLGINIKSLFFNYDQEKKELLISEAWGSAYMKIFLNYLQLLSISYAIPLNWDGSLSGMFWAMQIFSGSVVNILSLECLAGDFFKIPVVYVKALLMSLLPICIVVLLAAFWFTFWLIYIRNTEKQQLDSMYFSEHLLTSTVIVVFSIQPSIADSLLSLISCKEIGNKSYLSNYLMEECYTDSHKYWLFGLFFPAFLLYAFIMPILALIYMFSNRRNLYESNHIKKVGFLSIGYSYNKFYWEFIFFYRKILLIFIIKFISWSGSSKALLMILILWVSLWYQAKDNPYLTGDLNSVDFKATFVSFVTIFSGLLSFETRRIGIEVIVIIVVFFFNILFLYYWIRRMLIIKLPLFMKIKFLNCLTPIFNKMQPEFRNLQAQAMRVDLMQCMISTVTKNDIPGSLQRSRDNPRNTVFSHFKEALSKLIANAADEGRNSKCLNTSDDSKMKNKSSLLLLPTPHSNKTATDTTKKENYLSPKASLKRPIQLQLHRCSGSEPKDPQLREILTEPEIENEIEIIQMGRQTIKLKKPRFDDEEDLQLFSADRKETPDLDEALLKRRNLLDREMIETCDFDGLKKLVGGKIEELDRLYDQVSELRKEIQDLRRKNQELENGVRTEKKHAINHRLSSIKRLEAKKNGVYFQEDQPRIQTFASPSSDVTKKPHFLKHIVERSQVYREWVRNSSSLCFLVSFLSFQMRKETFSRKMKANIIKIQCQIKNEITQKIDSLSIKMATTQNLYIYLDLISTSDYIKNLSLKPNETYNLEFLIKKISLFEKEESDQLTFEIFLIIDNVPFMYEIQLPLFPILFFKFCEIKPKTFEYLENKYSFEFMTLSYLRNQDIDGLAEFKRIFPQLISKGEENSENFRLLGVFNYSFNNQTVRFLVIIQEAFKNLNFRCKMKKKTQKDFYEAFDDKKELINDLRENIIEDIFASFIMI